VAELSRGDATRVLGRLPPHEPAVPPHAALHAPPHIDIAKSTSFQQIFPMCYGVSDYFSTIYQRRPFMILHRREEDDVATHKKNIMVGFVAFKFADFILIPSRNAVASIVPIRPLNSHSLECKSYGFAFPTS
jgi:hypothetical protein